MKKIKFYLQHVRLNQGGYDDSGRYFGVGKRLYSYESDAYDGTDGWIRANDRADAKACLIEKFSLFEVSFYR